MQVGHPARGAHGRPLGAKAAVRCAKGVPREKRTAHKAKPAEAGWKGKRMAKRGRIPGITNKARLKRVKGK